MQHVSEIAKNIKPGNGKWARVPPEPRRYSGDGQRVTLASLKQHHQLVKGVIGKCHEWAERKRAGILDASMILVGPVGTGKTHIAKALLWSIYTQLEDGTPVAPCGRFYEANDIIQRLDSQTRPGHMIPNDCPIVVIDDVGSEQHLPYISEMGQETEIKRRYFAIIDYCYNWQISIVITSNLSLPGLEAHIGPRAWSRLQEMAPSGFMFDLSGVPDYRRQRSGR